MARVFLSRHGVNRAVPGDGSAIDWEIGERVLVTDGKDKGRIFVVTSEGRDHPDAPVGHLVREGYFEDDPTRKTWAKLERYLWFADR